LNLASWLIPHINIGEKRNRAGELSNMTEFHQLLRSNRSLVLAVLWQAALLLSLAGSKPALAAPIGQDIQPWNRLYVTNYLSNNVSVVDLTANRVMATIPVGNGPTGMAVSPDVQQVYVANSLSGTVSVISTALNQVTNTIPIPSFYNASAPFGLAMTHDGAKVYVTNLNDGTVRVIDTRSKKVVDTITKAYDWALRYIAISPDGEYAWAIGTGDGKISIIRTDDNEVVARITGLPSARHMAFTPDGSRAYVTGEKFSHVYVIDTQTFSLLTVIHFPAGATTITLDISQDGRFAMISNFYGKVARLDIDPKSPTYHKVLAEIPPKSFYQYCIVISPDGRFAYLSNQADRGGSPNSINIIDLNPQSPTHDTIISSIAVGQQPWGIAIVRQQQSTATPDQ
jgi:YVTN family beta-propeller protein